MEKKLRGKKPTIQQYKLLESYGIKDNLKNWLYLKTESVDNMGGKSTSKNLSKMIYMTFVNRETMQELKILVK